MCRVINMGLDGHASRSQGDRKLTTIDAPSTFLLGRRSGTCPLELCVPRGSEGKGGKQTLERGLEVAVSLQFLSFCGVPLQAGKALNVRLIRCSIGQVIVIYRRGASLEVGIANQGRLFTFDLSRHVQDFDPVTSQIMRFKGTSRHLGSWILNGRRLGFLPIYIKGKTLRRNMCFFLKTLYFQNFTLLVGGDVFFLLRLVEEGKGEDGDSYCIFWSSFVEEHQFLRWA